MPFLEVQVGRKDITPTLLLVGKKTCIFSSPEDVLHPYLMLVVITTPVVSALISNPDFAELRSAASLFCVSKRKNHGYISEWSLAKDSIFHGITPRPSKIPLRAFLYHPGHSNSCSPCEGRERGPVTFHSCWGLLFFNSPAQPAKRGGEKRCGISAHTKTSETNIFGAWRLPVKKEVIRDFHVCSRL